MVPNAQELAGNMRDKNFLLPISCRYLFLVYHQLCKESKKNVVRITSWIKFWFKVEVKYHKLTKRASRNKTQCPKDIGNPFGIINTTRSKIVQGDQVFSDLGITGAVKDETYLSTFLVCWLCKFVLTRGDGDLIRPGVFTVASMMAHDRSFSLAIPVLASIYKGLNRIVSSSDPGKCDAIFPVHYVYAWLAEYFNTHISTDSALKPQMARYAGERMAKHFEESEAHDLFK
ncbi:unnamed protein product [Camellia sinensis]